MESKQQNLTPFERAAYNREQGAKRLAGIIITQAWIKRLRALRAAKTPMTVKERTDWEVLLINSAIAQYQHFGYDA